MSWITDSITANDFKGEISLPLTNTDVEKLNSISEEIVPKYMKKMLGIDLYADFEDSISGNTPDTKWSDLWDGAEYEHTISKNNVEFEGCKKMCLYFIWSELKKENTTATIEGDYQNEISNSTFAQVTNNKVIEKFNKGYVLYQNAKVFLFSSLESGSLDYDGLRFENISNKIIY